MIYLDNAATTKPYFSTVLKMIPYLLFNYGNPSSKHELGYKAAKAIDKARKQVASVIKCNPDEVYFTSGGSESDNLAIKSAAQYGKLHNKMHIVSTEFEHHAVLNTLNELKKEGFEITLIRPNSSGLIRIEDVEDAIREDTCLVTVMFVNNEIGTIMPIKQIGNLCKSKNILFHTDAVQACGHLNINVDELNVDYLSMSAHKFHGPKGVGCLYVRNKKPIFPIIRGGQQEKGKRAGTENVASIVGMGDAIIKCFNNRTKAAINMSYARTYFIKHMADVNYIINGSKFIPNRYIGNINIYFKNVIGLDLIRYLSNNGIYVSSGAACNSKDINPSYVLLSIGTGKEIASNSIRISLDESITIRKMKYVCKKIKQFIKEVNNV